MSHNILNGEAITFNYASKIDIYSNGIIYYFFVFCNFIKYIIAFLYIPLVCYNRKKEERKIIA